MKIEIKERKLTAGNRSLYLEYYETGFRKKENLHLYLVPEDLPKAKKLNREANDKARVIRAERLLNPPSFEKEELIAFNPVHSLTKVERFHAPDKHREYLTPEELTRFLNVECATENERTVQMAFGLSSMTGIRLGDMQHLRWGDIKLIDGVQTICIIQRKTKRPATIPLNDMALSDTVQNFV